MNNNAIYSKWKMFHYHKELEILKEKEYPAPRMIQMDIFNPCNHDCYFCVHRFHQNENFNKNFTLADSLKREKVFEVIEDGIEMGVKSFVLSGGGEPTLHPDFLPIAEKITDNFDMGLITNGCSRNNWIKKEKEMAEVVGKTTWVRFSINGGSRFSYSKVHATREEDFDVALKSVKNVVEIGTSTVGISYVVNFWNYHEISNFSKIASDLGVDYIRFKPVEGHGYPEHMDGKPLHEFWNGITEQFDMAKKYQREDFAVFFFDERADHAERDFYDEDDVCYYSHLTVYVCADMGLYPCCVKKYCEPGKMASIENIRFKDAWYGQERKDFYKNFKLNKECNGGDCFLKPKNDMIKYMLMENPPHVNFV